MARPREFDTDTALESICGEFWSNGYEATGIRNLENATGLARARLYAAFGSKHEMLCQAIDFYLDSRIDKVFQRVDNGGIAGIVNFFRTFAGIVMKHPEQAQMGCLVVNSMVELGSSDSDVAARAELYRDRVRGAFRSALTRDAEKGRVDGNVEKLTDLAFMMLMGLYVSVKGGARPDEIERLCGIAIGVVESWRRP